MLHYSSWSVNLSDTTDVIVTYIICIIVSEILLWYVFSLFPGYQLLTLASMFFSCRNMNVKKSWMTGSWKQLTTQKGLECCSVCPALIVQYVFLYCHLPSNPHLLSLPDETGLFIFLSSEVLIQNVEWRNMPESLNN